MDFNLTDEQRQIRDTFARFCDERIRPVAAQLDEAGEYPRALMAELGAMGLFGLRYPDAVGGAGGDLVSLCLVLEEIARHSMSVAACVTMQSLMGTKFLEMLGNDEVRNTLLIPALRGEKIGAICMTEPDAGSDLYSMRTQARKVAGGYRLTGQKMWVTAAPVADFFTVFARTGEGRALSIFLIERSAEGLHVGKEIAKLGTWAVPTSEIALEDCFVPDDRRLSREDGDGEQHLRRLLAEVRIVTAALAVGGGRGAYEEAVQYAANRQQFGKPINRFQAVQLMLGEMAVDLESARRLVHYAAWLLDAGLPHHREAAMAKVCASENGLAICERSARVFASYGYSMEFPVQRHLRDIRFTLIGGGTNEILRMMIAREASK